MRQSTEAFGRILQISVEVNSNPAIDFGQALRSLDYTALADVFDFTWIF